MPSCLHWIATGDIHNDTAKLEYIKGLREAAGIIITGDLTIAGGSEKALKVLKEVENFNSNIFAQIGNMDKPEVTALLKERGQNLHAQAQKINSEITLVGVGGSPHTPFNTPSEFTEEEIDSFLKAALSLAGSCKNLVLVSHTPPLNTSCDKISIGRHVGSSAIRRFIEKYQPQLCLCGHIHEAASIDRIGQTVIINPGPLSGGQYASMIIDNGKVEAQLCRIS